MDWRPIHGQLSGNGEGRVAPASQFSGSVAGITDELADDIIPFWHGVSKFIASLILRAPFSTATYEHGISRVFAPPPASQPAGPS